MCSGVRGVSVPVPSADLHLWRMVLARDVPPCYGPWQTVYGLFRRWQRDGTWRTILTGLQGRADAAGLITGAPAGTTPRRPATSGWPRSTQVHGPGEGRPDPPPQEQGPGWRPPARIRPRGSGQCHSPGRRGRPQPPPRAMASRRSTAMPPTAPVSSSDGWTTPASITASNARTPPCSGTGQPASVPAPASSATSGKILQPGNFSRNDQRTWPTAT